MRQHNCLWQFAVVLSFGVLLGCGGDNIVPVSGVLKHKGKPVPDARVTFHPDEGRPVSGMTDGEGHFKLRYDAKREGVEIGTYRVIVEYAPLKTPEPGMPLPPPAEFKALFEKYSFANSKHKVKIDGANRDLKVDLD